MCKSLDRHLLLPLPPCLPPPWRQLLVPRSVVGVPPPSLGAPGIAKNFASEACRHMEQTETVTSFHFGTKIKIRGHLRHDYAPPGKIRWFIYQIVDKPCHLIYTGSSQLPAKRFLTHKSTCNSESSNSTGLSKHFKNGGCPNDQGRDKDTLVFTLVDHLDTTEDELQQAGHIRGPQCLCSVCQKLKELEDNFILKSGTFYSHGLNTRDQVAGKARCQW